MPPPPVPYKMLDDGRAPDRSPGFDPWWAPGGGSKNTDWSAMPNRTPGGGSGGPPPLPFRATVQAFESVALSQLAGVMGKGGSATKEKAEKEEKAMSFGEKLGQVTGALSAMQSVLSGVVGTAAKYAQAASPSAVLVLNQAMYDFSAVIGQAVTPVVYAAAEGIKTMGGVLLPVMRALTPVISKLTGVFLSLLDQALPAFEALGDVVVTVAGWFGDFVEIVSPLITVATALTTVFLDLFKGLVDFIAGLFGAGATSSIKGAFQEFAKYLLLAVASLASFVGGLFGVKGGGMVVQSLLKATDPNKPKPPDITGLGVAKDAQFTGFSEYGRKVSTAALIAGSGAQPTKPDNQWLADIHKQLQETARGGENQFDKAMRKIEAKFDELIDAILTGASKKAWGVTESTMEVVEDLNPFLKPLGAFRRLLLGKGG